MTHGDLAQRLRDAAQDMPARVIQPLMYEAADALNESVSWKAASPKPHTITRAELDEAATRFAEVGASGDWVSLEDMLVVALGALGIEVEGDE